MPPLQRTNSMPIGAMSISAMPSWPAPDGRRRTAIPSAATAAASRSCSRGVAGCRARFPHRLERERDAASRGDRLETLAHRGERGRALRVRRRTHVEREAHAAGDHVHRPGQRLDAADGADHVGRAGGDRFDREHALGRGRERVAAQCHRHGARVAGDAGHLDVEAIAAVDRRHDADRQPRRLEHRSLLDVELDVGEHVARGERGVADARGIEAERAHRVAQRHAVAARPVEQRAVERAGDRARAEQRRAEAHALLVAEADHDDRERQPRPAADNAATHSIAVTTPSMPS